MSEQSGEQVLANLESAAVVQAVNEWFAREPYIGQVFFAMPPQDRAAAISKITNDAIEAGFMKADAGKWLSHHVNKMYDAGQLPEINRAQEALHQYVQVQEAAAIYHAPKAAVERYLHGLEDERVRAKRQGQPTSCRLDSEECIFPG